MFKFILKNVRFEYVKVKQVTTAAGGSALVVNEDSEFEDLKRIRIPMDIAREFQVRHKQSKFFSPIETVIVYYKDIAIAIEAHPNMINGQRYSENWKGEVTLWRGNVHKSFRMIEETIVKEGRQWFIDGKYIYRFDDFVPKSVANAERLSEDGKFRSIEVRSFQLSRLSFKEIEERKRTCLAFVASDKSFAVTPPIWKDLGKLANAQLNRHEVKEDPKDVLENGGELPPREFRFDKVDTTLSVNLQFALSAGKTVGELFGYEAIEPLNLENLMIRLNTVNLPGVASPVKQTFDIGMKFKTALAWLIGLQHRSDTLEQYMELRGVIKNLCSKGIFYKTLFSAEHVFKKGFSQEQIPHIEYQQAHEAAKKDKVTYFMNNIKDRARAARNNVFDGGRQLANATGLNEVEEDV